MRSNIRQFQRAFVAKPHRGHAALGFTLIEVMIVLVIVAVLAAVALPSYQDSVRKGRRSDVISEISKAQQAEERWRANNATYNNDVSSNTTTGLRLAAGTTAATSYDTSSGYYNIALSGNSASAYVVTATAKTGKSQEKDTNCQCMRVTWSSGNATYEAASMATGGACGTYASTNAATCWRR